jgi:hypothetical protein
LIVKGLGDAVSSCDKYRAKATACLAQAELIRDPQARTTMLTIANGYLDLSDYAAPPTGTKATSIRRTTANAASVDGHIRRPIRTGPAA